MKSMLIGFTIGAITGAVALMKMQKADIPEKVLDKAKEKLVD